MSIQKSNKLEYNIKITAHYYGTAEYNSFDPYCEKGVFHTARTDFRIDWTSDSCSIPEVVPDQRLEITEVDKNVASGVAWLGITQYNNGTLASQFCNDMYNIEDMSLSEDGNTLYFEFNERHYTPLYEWERIFELTRQ